MAKKFIPLAGEAQPGAEADYEAAARYGAIRTGAEFLFYKGLTQVEYLPYPQIAWAYMRQEDSHITLCCGKGNLPSYFLMVMDKAGNLVKTPVDMERTVKAILKDIADRNPAVEIGYSGEKAQAFGLAVET